MPITRRGFVGLGLSTALIDPTLAAMPKAARRQFVVGTYTAEGGEGVYPLTHDVASDHWRIGAPMPAIRNMSFGIADARRDLFYALDENGEGTVAAYRRDSWSQVGEAVRIGVDPCHIAIDRRRERLAIADYGSGEVAVVALDPITGVPSSAPVLRSHAGTGPNAERQRGPHAHWVGFSPDGRWLHSVDLGADAIWRHDLRDGVAQATLAYRAPPGSGPRHLVMHPRLAKAYLLSELASEVTLLDSAGDGRFSAVQTVATVPAGSGTANLPAEVAINRVGDRLYVSNRGHDSIAVFAVARDGRLSPLQHIATGGHWPRFFLLVEESRRLLVANERSGTVQPFAILSDGRLAPSGTPIAAPGAAFIARL